ncbi:phosphatase PAP2 family protein [Sphingomonas sp. PAMC 26605]|uniref:phosphatase PAP2 family protein n=1 Tax=Sphingomonas sp. PAMC 26605 TaxID=1112214 RepID=UPI000496EBF3|nr:phosphatase PAP2 family protein [Sphingomonas sp. PAMC 26605]
MSIPTTSRFALPAPIALDPRRETGLIPGSWMLTGLAMSIACVAALLYDAGIAIDPRASSTRLFALAFALLAAIRLLARDPATPAQRVARDLAESVGLFMAIGLLGAVSTYPLAASTRGSIDGALQAIDQALHFDWLSWYQWVAAHRSLQLLGTAAYQSIFITPALILAHYAWAERRSDARSFLASFWLAAVTSLVAFRFIPALGPLATLWHGPVPYLPESGLYEADLLPALRDHAVHVVDLGTLRGLVSAPSFHTVSAVLYIAAGWGIARLRWTILALNTAMLLSTPIEGTHYLADMIAGALVAIAALALVGVLRRTLAARGR